MKQNYEEKINLAKELIDAQPVNNIKNINKKLELLNSLKEEYDEYLNKIKKELEKYQEKFNMIQINPNIENMCKKISLIKQKISFMNELNTPFEKMGLDIICYNIRNYQNNNLDYINDNIFKAIEIFKKVGINLTAEDFDYSIYFNQYVSKLLDKKTNNNLNELFEQIYWKNPNIINHIEMNIKYLYYKNVKKFDKYIKTKQNDIKESKDNLCAELKECKIKYAKMFDEDTYLNLEKFKNKTLKTDNFHIEKIEKLKSELSDNEVEERNFRNLLSDVIEYKKYEKYKFIIEEVKLILDEKDKNKNVYNNKLREIIKTEKKLYKLNKKYNKSKKESQKEDLKIEINAVLELLNNLYLELENSEFNEKVYKTIFNKSSISDVLKLASSYYIFISKCIKKYEKELNGIEVKNEIIDFVLNPNNTIINNVNMIDNYDFPSLISEQNRFMNMLINPDLLNIENIDNLIEKLKIILKSFDLKKINISLSEIENYITVIQMLSNN